MELKDYAQPKWVLETKRGWGMLLTFASTAMPFVTVMMKQYFDITIDAPMVQVFGQAVMGVLDSIGAFIGVVLWVWGSWHPTGPLVLTPSKAAEGKPVPPPVNPVIKN